LPEFHYIAVFRDVVPEKPFVELVVRERIGFGGRMSEFRWAT